jgi:hypothetical protein
MPKKIKRRIREKVITNTDGRIKMSAVLSEFAEPLLREAIDDASSKIAISMAAMCWNLALMPEDEHEEMINDMKTKLSETKPDEKIVEDIARMFIARKKELFSHIRRFIVDYDVKFINGQLHLNVVSSQMK